MELSLKSLSTPCSCGRAHTLEVERIFIEANLLNKIYEFLVYGKAYAFNCSFGITPSI